MLQWQYVCSECVKRDIHVVSFGWDGGSRIMKGMHVSTDLYTSAREPLLENIPRPKEKSPKIPANWSYWFCIERQNSIAYVQDIVHVAVKLKSRLLKPSILLPMGGYIAGAHHLRIVQTTFSKDIHGLGERDLDKQNFDAVLNIIQGATLLQNIPDALPTKQYIILMECVVESYFNK